MNESIVFHGVRGSYPQSGPDYALGGHTLCTAYHSPHACIVFDMGTGISAFSNTLPKNPKPTVHVCLSHYHLDHVMGLTLLEPLYTRDIHLILHAPILENRDPYTIFNDFIKPPLYPFFFDLIKSSIDIRPFHVGETFTIEDCTISTLPLHHPGGSCGYRVRRESSDFCYITDVGIEPDARTYPIELGEFVKNTPLLIQDAYFSPDDFEKFHFFGHGSYRHVGTFAHTHNVGALALYHHNPRYTDTMLKNWETYTQTLHPHTFLTHEGMILDCDLFRI